MFVAGITDLNFLICLTYLDFLNWTIPVPTNENEILLHYQEVPRAENIPYTWLTLY